jgi:predicted PurR-regulated permease PerM
MEKTTAGLFVFVLIFLGGVIYVLALIHAAVDKIREGLSEANQTMSNMTSSLEAIHSSLLDIEMNTREAHPDSEDV